MQITDAFKKHLNETPEFKQAFTEVRSDLLHYNDINSLGDIDDALRMLLVPDKVTAFKVVWTDDANATRVNRGYRVQYSNILGPYKGGLRFVDNLSLDTLLFLGFEQCFKNALTGLPMGGAKGGADFNPRQASPAEIKRFCHAFLLQLLPIIGPDKDIPAGDIGVGDTEIAYMFDQYRRVTGSFDGVLTGRDPIFGGSELRSEATGYGLIYFLIEMLAENDEQLEGKHVCISGAGNVALHACEMLLEENAKVLTLSNSSGTAFFKSGITKDQLVKIKDAKKQKVTLEELAEKEGFEFRKDAKPWGIECDVALPCAVQNELEENDAKALVDNNVSYVAEGANMPCTAEALKMLQEADISYAPGKATNAGGVATSGLEISQSRMRRPWPSSTVREELKAIMQNIHNECRNYARELEGHSQNSSLNYRLGANVASFKKLSEAMSLYGLTS